MGTEEGNTHSLIEIIPQWLEELKESFEQDNWAQQVMNGTRDSNSQENITVHQGVIRVKGRLYVGTSKEWRCKVMNWMHDSSIGGHLGVLSTYQRVKKLFYWPKLKEEVMRHVRGYEVCQLNKHEHVPTPGLLEPIPVPTQAWQTICMDFITGLPKSEGKEVILVIIDKFTKYAHFIALSHLVRAVEVAQLFLERVYRLHGLPTKVITNRDPIFTSVFCRELMKKLEIKINLSTVYHPQTDGQNERLNQCLEQHLRCMIHQEPKKWVKWLQLAEWWYNTNHHTALGMFPFKALYGYEPPHLPLGSIPDSIVNLVDELLKERLEIVDKLKDQLQKAVKCMKKYADKKRNDR